MSAQLASLLQQHASRPIEAENQMSLRSIITLGVAVALATLMAVPNVAAQARPDPRPARVIIFHMDSMLADAPERLSLSNWLAVAAEGTRASEMTTVIPYHPTDSGYFVLSTTSFPNPTTAAGTLFLEPAIEQTYLQHRFKGHTALIAGSTAYRSIGEGFTYTNLSQALTDERVVEEGLRQLREHPDLSFMRLILQDANAVLQRVGFTRENVPWRGDAYGEGSPYFASLRRADALLGRFVDELKRMDKYEDTLLVLMPDGAARGGWHGPQQEESWRLPFALRGPGIAKRRVIGYAENIDVAPTIAAMMGVEPPNADGASGRVLTEVMAGQPATAAGGARRIERLNRQHKEYLRLTGWMQVHAGRYPLLDLAWMASHNRLVQPTRFWDLSSIDEWRRAGSFDRMLADNEAALVALRDALARSGAPALPD
ncbi:sulfatase-like hydrolase/transferase [Rhodopseudomonas palustris]|uniref:Sulfatase n=1 Tax=Rhodopseudomonas palustris (strain BisB18) TaxID=316056 RepID=Q214A0_RHOPB